jgi:hypothetical protein
LQADSKRRKQGAHQDDGYRCALKKTALHEGSLPWKVFFGVICITGACAGNRCRAPQSAYEPEPG